MSENNNTENNLEELLKRDGLDKKIEYVEEYIQKCDEKDAQKRSVIVKSVGTVIAGLAVLALLVASNNRNTSTKYVSASSAVQESDSATYVPPINYTPTPVPTADKEQLRHVFPLATGMDVYCNNDKGDGNLAIAMFVGMPSDRSNETKLTTGDLQRPQISPDRRKILFADNGKMYIIDVNGKRCLVNDNVYSTHENASHLGWSPDGTKIVFTSTRDGNKEIYIMNSDGSNQTRLTNNSVFDGYPSFSPDGTKIAFQSDREGGKMRAGDGRCYDFYYMNIDGSNQTRDISYYQFGKSDVVPYMDLLPTHR